MSTRLPCPDDALAVTTRRIIWAQAAYYVTTGLWPLLHLRSFAAVAGPKPDRFQTQTTGALFAAVGVALWSGDPQSRATRVLAGSTAAAALGTELLHLRRLRKVFAAEACLEAMFLLAACLPSRSGHSN